ncbi:ferredoxin [Macellibacteroides fermentans]|uniref:Ferredoxin n=1 Tax=Macellibacteroides fermentans TaxID=879969 RepID=A0A8E2A7V6_9PORP|nr:ferredoxin [Macellibacteroides fermentans]
MIENSKAVIDESICKKCRKCIPACPSDAIS